VKRIPNCLEVEWIFLRQEITTQFLQIIKKKNTRKHQSHSSRLLRKNLTLFKRIMGQTG